MVKRTKKEKALHEYGPPERSEWLKALPCVSCGASPCDQHHVQTAGTGLKAHHRWLVPLCVMCHRAVLPSRGKHTFIKDLGKDGLLFKAKGHWMSFFDWDVLAIAVHEEWERVRDGTHDVTTLPSGDSIKAGLGTRRTTRRRDA